MIGEGAGSYTRGGQEGVDVALMRQVSWIYQCTLQWVSACQRHTSLMRVMRVSQHMSECQVPMSCNTTCHLTPHVSVSGPHHMSVCEVHTASTRTHCVILYGT